MATALGIKVLSLFSTIFEGAIKVADVLTGKGKDTDDHSWQKPGPNDRKILSRLVVLLPEIP